MNNNNLVSTKDLKNNKKRSFGFFIIILNLINLALISSLMIKKTNFKIFKRKKFKNR